MTNYIALLRGINVGGHNLVAMSDLRDLLSQLGFAGVRTLLQSGNVVFQGNRRQSAGLERLLEVETAKRIKVAADYVVRTATEWQSVIARNPFPKQAEADPGHLIVMFLKQEADLKNVQAVEAAIKGPELVCADGKHLYIVYPAGIGRSKLTGTLIERTLGTRGTARNWNTVLKLAALTQLV